MIVTLVGAPAWDRNTQADTAAGLEAPDTAMVQALPVPREPQSFPIARVGFAGLRKELNRIVSTVRTGLPIGPPIVIASRATANRPGLAAVSPIAPAASYSPALSVEQTAPYWEFLQS